jgi:hypothetical protein
MLLDVVGCCWMLLDVVECCWVLLDVVECWVEGIYHNDLVNNPKKQL